MVTSENNGGIHDSRESRGSGQEYLSQAWMLTYMTRFPSWKTSYLGVIVWNITKAFALVQYDDHMSQESLR